MIIDYTFVATFYYFFHILFAYVRKKPYLCRILLDLRYEITTLHKNPEYEISVASAHSKTCCGHLRIFYKSVTFNHYDEDADYTLQSSKAIGNVTDTNMGLFNAASQGPIEREDDEKGYLFKDGEYDFTESINIITYQL